VSLDDVRTVHLGQFSHEHADQIAGELERAGIAWWYKAPGFFSQIWELGVRLFVDRNRLDEAQAIAAKVLAGGSAEEEDGPSRSEGPSDGEDYPEGEGSSSGHT
jgi:hypothetical protein